MSIVTAVKSDRDMKAIFNKCSKLIIFLENKLAFFNLAPSKLDLTSGPGIYPIFKDFLWDGKKFCLLNLMWEHKNPNKQVHFYDNINRD